MTSNIIQFAKEEKMSLGGSAPFFLPRPPSIRPNVPVKQFRCKITLINVNTGNLVRQANNVVKYLFSVSSLKYGWTPEASWVGRQGGTCPPSVGKSRNFRKFQNFTSTAHVRDDVMGFECIHSSEK